MTTSSAHVPVDASPSEPPGGEPPDVLDRAMPWVLDAQVAEGALLSLHRARLASGVGPGGLLVRVDARSSGREALARLVEAVRAQGDLAEHPSLPPLVDTGVDEGKAYAFYRVGDGLSLADFARHVRSQDMVLPVDLAVFVALRVASALGALHAAGASHGDVRPTNVLLGEDGGVHLVGAGLAAAVDAAGLVRREERADQRVYRAPEELAGSGAGGAGDAHDTAARSDVHAAAVILWELVTGVDAASAREAAPASLAVRPRAVTLPSARSRRDEVPAALDGVLARALAVDPAARYPDADAFAAALERSAPPGYGESLGLLVREAKGLATTRAPALVEREVEKIFDAMRDSLVSSGENAALGTPVLGRLVFEDGRLVVPSGTIVDERSTDPIDGAARGDTISDVGRHAPSDPGPDGTGAAPSAPREGDPLAVTASGPILAAREEELAKTASRRLPPRLSEGGAGDGVGVRGEDEETDKLAPPASRAGAGESPTTRDVTREGADAGPEDEAAAASPFGDLPIGPPSQPPPPELLAAYESAWPKADRPGASSYTDQIILAESRRRRGPLVLAVALLALVLAAVPLWWLLTR